MNSPHIPNFDTRCSLQFVLEERATSSYWIGDRVNFICEEETHSTPIRNRTVFLFWLRKLLVVYLY